MWLSELVPASDPKGITGIMSVCAREKEEICVCERERRDLCVRERKKRSVSSVRSCGGGKGSCEGR